MVFDFRIEELAKIMSLVRVLRFKVGTGKKYWLSLGKQFQLRKCCNRRPFIEALYNPKRVSISRYASSVHKQSILQNVKEKQTCFLPRLSNKVRSILWKYFYTETCVCFKSFFLIINSRPFHLAVFSFLNTVL